MIKKHYEIYELDINGDGTDVWQAYWDKGSEITIFRGTKSEGDVSIQKMQNIHLEKNKRKFTVETFITVVDEFMRENINLDKQYQK